MAEFTREDKVEAIEGICKYDEKLVEALGAVSSELLLGVTDIHSELFGQIVQGINWTVEVLKQVMDILDEKEKKLDVEAFNDALTAFDSAYTAEDKKALAEAISEKLVPALSQLCEVGAQFS